MSPLEIIGIVVGGTFAAIGLWLVALARRDIRSMDRGDARPGPEGFPDGPPHADATGATTPTRLTIGLALIFAGYHLVVWSLPASGRPVAVPHAMWWVVAGGATLAVVGALVADRLERRG